MKFSVTNSISSYLALTISLTLTFQALAQQKSSERVSEKITDSKTTQKRVLVRGADSGLSVILGAEYGLMEAKPEFTELLSTKKGTAFELKALSGFLWEDFLLDAGLGWYSYKIRGTEKYVSNSLELISGDREIGVSGLLLELNPSYRITDNFFSGPIFQVRSPTQLDYFSEAASSSAGVAYGAQVGYQFFNSDLNSRIIAKALRNHNLKNWSDLIFMAGVQFGLPIRQPDSLVIRKSTTITKVREVLEVQKKDFRITVKATAVKLALDNIVNFYVKEGTPVLTPEAQSFLIDLSESLQSASSSWEGLRIDAQTQEHINVIKVSLLSSGLSEEKVKTGRTLNAIQDGSGVSVDFTFTGVRNPKDLGAAIRRAMNTMQIPENCQNGVCE